MMKEEYQKMLYAEEMRVNMMLRSALPGTETYSHLLNDWLRLCDRLDYDGVQTPVQASALGQTVATTTPSEMVEPEPEPESELELEPESEPEHEPEQDEAPTVLTREYVHGRLLAASGKGVLIQPIIRSLVPEGKAVKFSSIPAERYSELVDLLMKAEVEVDAG